MMKRKAHAGSLSPSRIDAEQSTAQQGMQGAAQTLEDGSQNPEAQRGISEARATSDPQTPRTPNQPTTKDGESPFRTLCQELGLSGVEIPALRRRRNSNPFQLRLCPGAVRSEATFRAAINEIIYNESRVQNFMRLSLTPAEAASVRDQQAARVLLQFNDDSLNLQDAFWYLEYAGWDEELAILHRMHDGIDRAEAPDDDSVQSRAGFPLENPKVDREPARGGDNFDETKLKVHYVQHGRARTMTYPEWQTFDRNNVDHVRALNTWRWKTILAQVGLRKSDKRKGSAYNELERVWIRNYERQNPKCSVREITDDFNATFAGVMLPGEMQPRPKRSLAAIACLRLRMAGEAEKSGTKKTAQEAELETKDGHRGDIYTNPDEAADGRHGGRGGNTQT